MGGSMNQEWIDSERAKLKAEQDNAIGLANQCAGALKILSTLEAEMLKVAEIPAEPAPPLVPELRTDGE